MGMINPDVATGLKVVRPAGVCLALVPFCAPKQSQRGPRGGEPWSQPCCVWGAWLPAPVLANAPCLTLNSWERGTAGQTGSRVEAGGSGLFVVCALALWHRLPRCCCRTRGSNRLHKRGPLVLDQAPIQSTSPGGSASLPCSMGEDQHGSTVQAALNHARALGRVPLMLGCHHDPADPADSPSSCHLDEKPAPLPQPRDLLLGCPMTPPATLTGFPRPSPCSPLRQPWGGWLVWI